MSLRIILVLSFVSFVSCFEYINLSKDLMGKMVSTESKSQLDKHSVLLYLSCNIDYNSPTARAGKNWHVLRHSDRAHF